MKTSLGIVCGVMALWSLGGLFSAQVRNWAWKKHPLSRTTSGVFCFLFLQASFLAFGVMGSDMIYTTIIPAILCACCLVDDYFVWRSWRGKRRKHEVMGLPGPKKYGNKKGTA
jgi:hypothetical protein